MARFQSEEEMEKKVEVEALEDELPSISCNLT
jgi:hypothetical protein